MSAGSLVVYALWLATQSGQAAPPSLPLHIEEAIVSLDEGRLVSALESAGFSMGVVAYVDMSKDATQAAESTGFERWVRQFVASAKLRPTERTQPLLPQSATVALARYAQRAAGRSVEDLGTAASPVLEHARASACRQVLTQAVNSDISKAAFLDAIGEAVSQAIGAVVPRGVVSTCDSVDRTAQPMYTTRGRVSLREALGQLADQSPGTVWVAASQDDGRCSIGVVTLATHGGICVAEIATVTAQP